MASTHRLRFACVCGQHSDHPVASDTDYVRYVPRTGEYIAECPGCERVRPIRYDEFEYPNGTLVLCVVAGASDDHDGESFSDAPPLKKIATTPVTSPCPSCGSSHHENAIQSGPEHPEVGWDYYDCPDCEAIVPVDSVFYIPDDANPTKRPPATHGGIR